MALILDEVEINNDEFGQWWVSGPIAQFQNRHQDPVLLAVFRRGLIHGFLNHPPEVAPGAAPEPTVEYADIGGVRHQYNTHAALIVWEPRRPRVPADWL